ncbi:MAG: type I glutamate--ammonia ligase [Lachnospirales bacterium]
MKTKQDIFNLVEEHDVKFIRLMFTDIFGQGKNVAITANQLEDALNNKVFFDGSSIQGFARIEESDMVLHPDIETFMLLPWKPQKGREARIICDVYTTDGKPFMGDPRNILKKVLKEADELGYTFHVGPECEFFIFQSDDEGEPTTITHDKAGYFDLGHIDNGENLRREIALTLEEMGFEIEASHHECADGQHEIDFKYGEALLTADRIMTFKLVVKTLARSNNLHATFMPKPVFGIHGSGMHINMSLSDKDGNNVFYDESSSDGLSSIANSYIAGILEHIKEMTAVTNPLVNSYKRLVPGYEAPIYIAWSSSNRTPLVRIPASRGAGTRVELRCPDPSANPYLALACCLASGLDGIKRGLKAPDSVDENIYHMSSDELDEKGVESLPRDLGQAAKMFAESEFIKEVVGEHLHKTYAKAKKKEYKEYTRQVSKWEVDEYLGIY